MRGHNEGKIKACADFYNVQELLIADKLKAKTFAGDGRSIISRIIELESKTKIEFEYEHVKTKIGNKNKIINKGLTIVLYVIRREKKKEQSA